MNQQDFERLLYRVRTWTGIGLIFLVILQVATGYSLTGKIQVVDLQTVSFLHTQFSWIMVYFFLTHAAVNLRFLFRRWWPTIEENLTKVLVVVYVLATLTTFYFHFLR
jgi:hypothetical protein